MNDWDDFIAIEQAKLDASRGVMQAMVDQMGIPLERLEELKDMDLNTLDPEVLQQMEAVGGVKLAALQSEKPVKDASSYRQRRNVLSV